MEHLVAELDKLEDQKPYIVDIAGRSVGLVKINGEVHAFENTCPHQGGPLFRGEVIPKVEQVLDENRRMIEERFSDEVLHIVCPWHGWEFDLRTGRCAADARFGLCRLETRIQDGKVYVRV